MTAAERQDLIMATLRKQQTARIRDFATACGCTERTIRSDIAALTATFPLMTVQGRYGGGIKLADWYQPQRTCLGPEQIETLKRLANSVSRKDRMILNSILDQFSPTR